jgi:hypothetical protein
MMLAVHLCGALSCKAVDIFNANPTTAFFALKPCCLPGRQSVKQKLTWALGNNHSFSAEELYGVTQKPDVCPPAITAPPEESDRTAATAAGGSDEGDISRSNGDDASEVDHGASTGAKMDGGRKRTPAASKRRREKRKLRLQQRNQTRDDKRATTLAQGADPRAARASGRRLGRGGNDGGGDGIDDSNRVVAGQGTPSVEHVARTAKGAKLLMRFSEHLVQGIAGTVSLETHLVQQHYFQNLFIFAKRP